MRAARGQREVEGRPVPIEDAGLVAGLKQVSRGVLGRLAWIAIAVGLLLALL